MPNGVPTELPSLALPVGRLADVTELAGERVEMTDAVAGELAATIGAEVSDAAPMLAGAASPVAERPDPAWLGSNTKVPPFPIVRIVPSGKALAVATTSVPSRTIRNSSGDMVSSRCRMSLAKRMAVAGLFAVLEAETPERYSFGAVCDSTNQS